MEPEKKTDINSGASNEIGWPRPWRGRCGNNNRPIRRACSEIYDRFHFRMKSKRTIRFRRIDNIKRSLIGQLPMSPMSFFLKENPSHGAPILRTIF